MNATKDQYETCLSAKSGECPFADKIAELKAKCVQWKARAEALEIETEALKLNREYWNDLSVELRAQRDQWKARAEARERALMQFSPCCSCVHRYSDIDIYPCADCGDALINYQFNEARFATSEAEAK